MVSVLSLLMVSTLRYRTFKDVRLNRKTLSIFMLVCLCGVLVATRIHPSYVLVVYFGAYLAAGVRRVGPVCSAGVCPSGVRPSEPVPADGVLGDEDEVDEQDFL